MYQIKFKFYFIDTKKKYVTQTGGRIQNKIKHQPYFLTFISNRKLKFRLKKVYLGNHGFFVKKKISLEYSTENSKNYGIFKNLLLLIL